MRFEWDEKKGTQNQIKHGVTFLEAITAFDDPFARVAIDERHSTEKEVRQWLIGLSDVGVLVVVFTLRRIGSVVRVISARKASKKERLEYERSKIISI